MRANGVKRRIRIDVTKDDIKNGSMWSAKSCPIALAFVRAGYNFFVGGGEFGPSNSIAGILSKRARKFVRDFDAGRKVKPSTFFFRVTL